MTKESLVKAAMSDVPKAVAAAVVDMGSGMLLAVKTVESHPQPILDLVAAATKDLFEGENVARIETLFKQARGMNGDRRYFQEMLVASTNLWHYFGRLKGQQQIVMSVVARGDVNVGLFLIKCREVLAKEAL